jgi:hypothetical protein
MHRIFLIQCVIMYRYFLEKQTRPTWLHKLWGSYGKREVSSVWCENARTNDGENPEITIPKSEVWISKCEVRNLKSEVWRYLSLSVEIDLENWKKNWEKSLKYPGILCWKLCGNPELQTRWQVMNEEMIGKCLICSYPSLFCRGSCCIRY